MTPDRFDVAIVGGGIVGLATALSFTERFPRLRLAVLEKEPDVGAHQTGHNSGVIHSGIYYRPGSSKARLCVDGSRRMVRFCEQHGIRVDQCGKVVVATTPTELEMLDSLFERGRANGVEGLEKIGPARLREIEPHASGLAAIYSPATAIVDFREVARAMTGEAERRGVELVLSSRVVEIAPVSTGLRVQTQRGRVFARYLVNCAGLYADIVAQLAGARLDVQIVPFRGEYYRLKPQRRGLVRALIYPVPDPRFPFLGVHFTRTVHGDVEAGPNAVLAFAREGYSFTRLNARELLEVISYRGFWAMARRYWRTGVAEVFRSINRRRFIGALQRLVPEVRASDLVPHGAGVRAQAVTRDGTLVDDFHIVEAAHSIHVLNAPSPAATAALAIGDHIVDLASRSFH